jgi:hypothetical protein
LLSEGNEGKTNKNPKGFILALLDPPLGIAKGNPPTEFALALQGHPSGIASKASNPKKQPLPIPLSQGRGT